MGWCVPAGWSPVLKHRDGKTGPNEHGNTPNVYTRGERHLKCPRRLCSLRPEG